MSGPPWRFPFVRCATGLGLLVLPLLSAAQKPPPVLPDDEVSTPGTTPAGPTEAKGLAPSDVQAEVPKDDPSGAKALITWMPPTGEPPAGKELKGYRIHRATNDGEFQGLLEPVTQPEEVTAPARRPLKLRAAAKTVGGLTAVLLREVLEQCGARLYWSPREKRVRVTTPTASAELRIGDRTARVNGVRKDLAAAPHIMGGRTVVPLELIAAILGARVSLGPKATQLLVESGRPRLSTQVQDLWSWNRYRFKAAALYGAKVTEQELKDKGEKPWFMAGQVPPEPSDKWGAPEKVEEALGEAPSQSIQTRAQWYRVDRTNVLICSLLFAGVVIWFIRHARSGRAIYVRPIAGMEAIDEAIGRATEMGKPILYVAGLGGLGGISTITAMMILGRVARRTAEYETPLLVPCVDPLVMLAAREIVKEAYLNAGKPDAYREQDVFFVTDRQFAYVAGVDGIMLRERPAANLYMGSFYAEALILAETGSVSGAIQIAGTDSDTQIPFFVTACDYTLMGEELYAATAYLSREPMLLAQLRAQDIGKATLGLLLIAALVAATVAAFWSASGNTQMQHAADLIKAALDLFRPA